MESTDDSELLNVSDLWKGRDALVVPYSFSEETTDPSSLISLFSNLKLFYL